MNNKIPNGWKVKKLGEITDIKIGGTPARKEEKYWDSERKTENYWVAISDMRKGLIKETKERITDLGVKNSNVKLIPKGTVMMSFKLSIGKIAIAGVDLYTNEAIASFISNENEVINEYLYYALANINYRESVDTAVKGQTLNKSKLQDLEIYIPHKQEQQKIAVILTSTDEAIEKTEAIVQQTEEVKKGLMQQLFSRGTGHTEFVKTHVGSIPASWKVVNLSDCSEIKSGVTKGRKLSNKETFPVPYLRVANVQDGYLDLSEIKYIDVTQEELERYALEEGDILLTEGGDADKLGRGYIWHGEIPNCIHQNHVFRVRIDRTMIIPEYLAFLVGSDYGKSYFMKCAKQTTNLASINSTQLKAFPVLLPPQNEQIAIVKILNSVNEKIKKEQETLVNLQTLKQGLMQSLLTGKVRVNVDEIGVTQV